MKNRFCLRHVYGLILFLALHAAVAGAQRANDVLPSATAPSQAPALPYHPSLDLSSMDKAVDPCVDFYRYSCGGWQKANPIPPDRTSWSVYAKLFEDNLKLLREILEQAAIAKQRDAATQKIGDFYGACVDEATVNRRGLAAIQSELDAIAGIKSTHDLPAVIGRLQLAVERSPILFGVGSIQDPDNSEQEIANLDQGGLGLPDRDYYTKEDAKSKEIRERYVQHVQKIFVLLGDSSAMAQKRADAVMRTETALAKASQTRVERRDPHKLVHKMTVAELSKIAPNFDWSAYLKEIHPPAFQILNVMSTDFFKEVNARLASESIEDWKNYLRYHVANAYSPYLSDDFSNENFEFYRKYLRGAQQQEPRWKRCVEYVDRDLSEALGQVYVSIVFSGELKASTLNMVGGIEKAMEQRINQLGWMSPETKQQALTKLHGIRNKIGYPDKWRDYGAVEITAHDIAGNVRNAVVFESRRQLGKISRPVDHGEWEISTPSVDAYFDPQMNDINFPAGVLQPPLYDAKMDDAPNYGDTGGTIGHELTHAFDDEGSQFDAKGNLKNWWTADDAKEFAERTQCVDDQYSQYVSVDDIHLNGKLTLGENVADLGGEILGYIAWKDANKDKDLEPIDGLTPEQRFFIGFAQWDCSNERPEQLREWAITNPHSPAVYRINGVVVNMPEFAKAFSCKAGQPMVAAQDKLCKVW
jgi:putative endopeptidase